MGIRIIVDSASDLPQDLMAQYGIEMMPLLVYVDEAEYQDSIGLSSDALYERMIGGAKVKTAQIPLSYFLEAFERMAQTGDAYIYPAFSSRLSGTYQSSILAKEQILADYPDFKLTIIDTKCASLQLAIMAVEAAQMIEQGAAYDTIVAHIENASGQMEGIFSVDDLEYLFRGGRVGRAQATLGNILNIKPILNIQDGYLIPIDKIKGKKKRIQRLIDYVEANGAHMDQQLIAIGHSVNLEEAAWVKSYLETTYGAKRFIVGQLGCVVGAHTGPGVIAIFFKRSL